MPRLLREEYSETVSSETDLKSVIDWEEGVAYDFGVTANLFLNVGPETR